MKKTNRNQDIQRYDRRMEARLDECNGLMIGDRYNKDRFSLRGAFRILEAQ
ncbi:MAG: hypothetical protein H6Q66_2858 [Firmicutes bacterium]|nr:hypothetical protein [Bacillota bacterium]